MEDARLLEATAAGDRDAYAAFYRRHLPRVVAFTLRATGDPELAADLTGEVFAAALVACRPSRWWIARADCGQGGAIQWAGPRLVVPLTLYFRGGRFVAYVSGGPASTAGRVAQVRMATPDGLDAGMALASAESRMGVRLSASAAHGGSFHASTYGGPVEGFVRMNAQTGKPVIATIGAGAAQCAAVAP